MKASFLIGSEGTLIGRGSGHSHEGQPLGSEPIKQQRKGLRSDAVTNEVRLANENVHVDKIGGQVAEPGCAKNEPETPAASETPPPPPAISLADLAGKWSMRGMNEARDNTLVTYELNATVDTSGWTIVFPNRRTVPVRVGAVAGDSVVIDARLFESVLRRGAPTTECCRCHPSLRPRQAANSWPRAVQLARTRSSRESIASAPSHSWKTTADAKWSASSVRTGSLGKGRDARVTTSPTMSMMTQPALASASSRWAASAAASPKRPRIRLRSSARLHSMMVRREVTTLAAPARACRTESRPASLRSHASTALLSA